MYKEDGIENVSNPSLTKANNKEEKQTINQQASNKQELEMKKKKTRAERKKKVAPDKKQKKESTPISVLITLTDVSTKALVHTHAMIDSGSDFNVMHERLAKQVGLTTQYRSDLKQAYSIDGRKIGTGIHKIVQVLARIGNHEEQITFSLADLGNDTIILGHPWLAKHNPTMDWEKKTLQFNKAGCKEGCLLTPEIQTIHHLVPKEDKTGRIFWASYKRDGKRIRSSIRATISKSAEIASAAAKSKDSRTLIEQIPAYLHEYLDVFDKVEAERQPSYRGKLDLHIYVVDGTQLRKGPIYKLSDVEVVACREQINELLRKEYIRESDSPCSSPVIFAGKKDGGLRLCVDYRWLNSITIPDHFPLPNTEELLNSLKHAKVFSKFDLRAGFNLICIAKGHEYLTAMRTRFGVFEWLVMPMGLKNAPSQFQKIMNSIFKDVIGDWLIVYIDDILIYSHNFEEHKAHTIEVLKRLRENKLFCKPEKCDFDTKEVEYLGHIVGNGQLRMDPEKVKAMTEWPRPQNKKQVQQLLGFANFYRRFIKKYTDIVYPLTQLTGKKDWVWNKEEEDAFEKFKAMFTSKPVLVLPDMSKQFWVKCDASDYAIGGVLLQKSPEDGYLHPICYMSKALSGSELNWTVFDKEMYALIVVFRLWRQFLQSPHHPVRVLSDHLNLTHWVTLDIRFSRRLVRWSELLSEYNFTITHIAGVKNVEADALSRRPDHEKSMTVIKGGDGLEEVYLLKPMHFDIIRKITVKPDHYIIKKIAGLTKLDDFARKILLEPRKHWKILKLNNTTQVLTFNGLIYVPNNRKIKRLILQSRHDAPYAGHLGRRKTLASVSRDYYWPGMMKYVIEYTKSCDLCQRNRIDTHKPFGKLQPLPVPKGPWREIGYDMVGPLPESEGYNAIMTIVDRLTKQAHFIPCRTNLDTPDCAKLFMKEIWRLHGTPTKVISDRGPIFNSKFMHELYKGLGIEATYSTAYHPQTDGQAERTNQIAEQYLRKYVNEEQTNWAELLPLAEFAYNSAEQESIHMSPFQAIYGYQPKFSPKDEFVQTVPAVKQRLKNIKRGFEVIKKAIREAQAKQKEHYDKKRKEAPIYKVGDWVLIRQDNLTTVRDSQKLDHRKAGPFKIIKITGKNTVQVKFTKRMKGLHSNINVRLLELYHPETIEGRTKPPPPPVVISKDNIEYEIEKIIKHRINKDKNKCHSIVRSPAL